MGGRTRIHTLEVRFHSPPSDNSIPFPPTCRPVWRQRDRQWGWEKSWDLFGGSPSGSAPNDTGRRYWLKVLVAQSCLIPSATPWAVAARLLCPRDSPGKNIGVGSHSLLQGIFPGYRAECCFFSHFLLAPAHTHVTSPSSFPRRELTDLWWWKMPNWEFMPGRWRVGILAAVLSGPNPLAPAEPLPSGHNPSICPHATSLFFGASFFFFFFGDTFSQQIFKHIIFIWLYLCLID